MVRTNCCCRRTAFSWRCRSEDLNVSSPRAQEHWGFALRERTLSSTKAVAPPHAFVTTGNICELSAAPRYLCVRALVAVSGSSHAAMMRAAPEEREHRPRLITRLLDEPHVSMRARRRGGVPS